MIRIVTENPNLINEELYQKISVSEALSMLYKETFIAADTETTGLSPHSDNLTLVQLGNKEFQIVIDTQTVDIRMFAKLFEDKTKVFLFHNAKFDLQMLYKHKIVVKKVYDSYLVECLLHLGFPKGIFKHSLAHTVFRYLEVVLDKTERSKITRRINSDSIIYAAEDIKYLHDVMKAQMELLKQKDLVIAARFENAFVRVLAYVEFCGIRLDVDRWKKRMDSDEKHRKDLEDQLCQWVINHGNPKYIDYQIDLFNQENIHGTCKIEWSSPKQVIPFFEELGFKLDTIDKKTKRLKKSVGAEIIKTQLNVSPIAKIYVDYKKYDKSLTAFGQNYLDMINPVSGNIHSNFTQLMNTTRLSSGSDDDEDIESVNIQNIPKDDETRACFIPEDGYSLIDVDYTAQEDLVFTEMSREPKLIEFYNDTTTKRDGHSFVAKMCYPEILNDIPELEVADKFPKLRSEAKKAKFAINVSILLEKILLYLYIIKFNMKIIELYQKGLSYKEIAKIVKCSEYKV